MKIFTRLVTFVFLLISLLSVHTTHACTIISASNGETILFAGNEDQFPNSSSLVVDNSGTFGVIYFSTPWAGSSTVMQMGINEKGLSFDTNWIPAEKLNPHPEKKEHITSMNIYLELIDQIMKELTTVDEVFAKMSSYNWGTTMAGQIQFVDRFGNAIIIYPGVDGELTYSRKPKGNGYLVTTNFNHARREKVSWSLLDFIYSSLFDGTYETAEKMLSKVGDQNELTVEFMASVLKATHRDWVFDTRFSIKTIFSAVYDLQKLQIYLYYNSQFDKPYVLDVKKELAMTGGYRKIPLKDLISNRDIEDRKN